MQTTQQILRQAVHRTPERDALVDVEAERRISYDELESGVRRAAAELHRLGVRSGDTVLIVLADPFSLVHVFFATQWLGAVAVPLNHRLASEGTAQALERAEPAVVVFDESNREAVTEVRSLNDAVYAFAGDRGPSFATTYDFDDSTADVERREVSPTDPSTVLFTSGTTGTPKGVPLDHRTSAARVLLGAPLNEFDLGERVLGALPLFHTAGLHTGLLATVLVSGTYVFSSGASPNRYVDAIRDEDVETIIATPTQYRRLLDAPDANSTAFQSVTTTTWCGAPMEQSLFERIHEVMDPRYVMNGYGTTEIFAPISQLHLDEGDEPNRCGRASPTYFVRVVEPGRHDPTATVDAGVEGELAVRGHAPAAFDGYLDGNEEAFEDGWFFTGDGAVRTESGGIRITGRLDDVILSGGEVIWPDEIERSLLEHPDVADVTVFGEQSDEWGETPVARVTVTGDVSATELDEWSLRDDSLADFKRPRRYEFVREGSSGADETIN